MAAKMKKGCIVALLIAVAVSAGVFIGLPAWWRTTRHAAGEQFRRDAVRQIQEWAEAGWEYEHIAFLAEQHERTQGQVWLADHLIRMHSGEWIVYFAECSKANPRIADIFIGRGSDGRWYYSTYHFCVGMITMWERPRTLADFVNEYSMCEFDGDIGATFGNTVALMPPQRREPRTYDSGIQPGLPDLGPIQRVATAAIPIATNSDPDLAGHGLDFFSIRYEHRFGESGSATGVEYTAIYRDSTLSGGNTTGIDIDLRDSTAYLKTQEGGSLWSSEIDGEPKVPEGKLMQIGLSAITSFWPQIHSSRLSLEEIVCTDPMFWETYSVTYRLKVQIADVAQAAPDTLIELRVTTNGLVLEKDIEWRGTDR